MKIAILGYGTVGSGVYDIITNGKTEELDKIEVKSVFARSRDKMRLATDDINEILDDEERVIDCNENAEGKAHNCNEEACGETCIWSRLDNAMTKILSETSLEDFIKNGKKI